MKVRSKQLAPQLTSIKVLGGEGSTSGSIEGYASTFDDQPDRDGDRVMPGAAGTESVKVPLLAYHDKKMPIGVAVLTPDMYGLKCRAEFAPTAFAQEIRALVKAEALPAFSISFSSRDYVKNDFGGVDFQKFADIYETSVVPIPANPRALVSAAKSLDGGKTQVGEEREGKKQYVEIEPPMGTYEAVQEDVREALGELYSDDSYISIIATWPDHVAYEVSSYPSQETDGAWQVDYVWRGEDDVTLGTPVEAQIGMTVSEDTDQDENNAPAVVQSSANENKSNGESEKKKLKVKTEKKKLKVKTATAELVTAESVRDAAESYCEKDGRRNSDTDQKALDQAHEYIVKAGAMCGAEEKALDASFVNKDTQADTSDEDGKSVDVEDKSVDGNRNGTALADVLAFEAELLEMEMV